MAAEEFIAPDWRELFQRNGLSSFEDFWQREIAWFEPPNFRRGGWSGVGRVSLATLAGGEVGVFVKRQENHFAKTWRHPIRGIATLIREFVNLRQCEAAGVPVPRLLYFAHRRAEGKSQAVLVVEELLGFRSLKELAAEWSSQNEAWPARTWTKAAAEAVAKLHRLPLRHNCLYGKHLFLKREGDSVEACIIDLEKAKRARGRKRTLLRDLDTLYRHSPGVRRVDGLRFLRAYLEASEKTEIRGTWKSLVAKIRANS